MNDERPCAHHSAGAFSSAVPTGRPAAPPTRNTRGDVMGLFDFFTGTKRPADGVAPHPAEAVRAALLSTNSPDRPFVVRDGHAEGVDLVAEWKIADAHWSGYFGTTTRTNRTLMRLDAAANQVRALDEEFQVVRSGRTSRPALGKRYGRGQINKKSSSATFSRDENGKLVKQEERTFSSAELKGPLQDVVTGLGWTWRGVLFGSL
ncbi:hypothetical protein EIL87_08400 [Saccharopolyspora rhizosphaerae]|uniref:Uncharacterized protein n=1 Tax=Saccharopolyspora rhizosphaerae TaxID=2492662 RepID=A0A426JYF9_9PSEU|nr:hypothetical protein [Saccharopolyspora rhizosphaerae]RRO18245.1 hypothetical protein EIL87_08400 [Saccharopolyspora rhizosphaerae]